MVCVICVYLAQGGVGGQGGEWMRGFDLGFTNLVGMWSVGPVFGLWWCGELIGCLEEGWWCYICVSCESGLFV